LFAVDDDDVDALATIKRRIIDADDETK